MHYLMLLTNAPDGWDAPELTDSADDRAVIDDWTVYTRALHEAGILVTGGALGGVDTATSVQVRDGRKLVVDGPFTETREHVMGFYVIDVPDLDTALTWAARVPSVRTGTVEVRPMPTEYLTETMLAAAATGTV